MLILAITSLVIRVIVTVWTCLAYRRLRDRRIGLAAALALVLTFRMILSVFWADFSAWSKSDLWDQLIAFFISVLLFAFVTVTIRLMEEQQQLEELQRKTNAERESLLERLSTLLDRMPVGCILNDVEFRFIFWNPAAEKIFGYQFEEVRGKHPFGMITPQSSQPIVEQIFRRLSVGDMTANAVSENITKDGRTIVCEWSNTPLFKADGTFQGILSMCQDITERTRTENERESLLKRLRMVLEEMPIGCILTDSEFKFTFLNPAAERTFGFREDELLGMRPLDTVVWPPSRPLVEDRFQRLAQGDLSASGSNENVTKAGRVIVCDWSNIPLFNPDGTFQGILCMCQDITERRRAEIERESLIGQLETKNAELERFAYTVSHDLKGPLITVKGFLGLLEQDLQTDDRAAVKSDVDRISAAADRMKQLLDELLELSRIGRIVNPPQVFPLADLAREAAEHLDGQLRERNVCVEIADNLPTVRADRIRLLEVLQNLLENSVKFLGEQPNPRIEIGSRTGAEEPIYFVRDNGIGIDPRFHDKVFGLFEKLAPDSPGTGIGLALVKRIIEVHGGRIWIESAGPGTGTTICFTLPTTGKTDYASRRESDS